MHLDIDTASIAYLSHLKVVNVLSKEKGLGADISIPFYLSPSHSMYTGISIPLWCAEFNNILYRLGHRKWCLRGGGGEMRYDGSG